MRVLSYGSTSLLLDCADRQEARAWYLELRSRRDAGQLTVDDLVPGARTVLVDGVVDPSQLAAELAGQSPAPMPTRSAPPGGRTVEVPTVYDGPDLAEVAALWGMSIREVVDLHTSTEFSVAFCGFAPGFAYMSGLPERLALPRHTTPRPQVPAGSVALAGEYCAVYPARSPGGWQLIGRTDVVLFDVGREPSMLLPPGTRVTFTETR